MIDEEVLANIIEMWTKIPVDKVLLVGGSTRVPCVQEIVKK